MENINTEIFIAIIGCALSVGAFFIGRNKDSEKRGREDGEIKALLNHIIKAVDEIRIDFKATNLKVDNLATRVVKIEESEKALHRRVDKPEEKIK